MKIALAWMAAKAGRSKSPAARSWTGDYLGRLAGFRRYATVEGVELAGRDPQAALLARATRARLWLLDPAGQRFTSPQFADWLEKQGRAGAEILLAVGGADGFSPAVVAAARGTISLSPLTFSHELARVMAAEQLYRALALLTGHPYPH